MQDEIDGLQSDQPETRYYAALRLSSVRPLPTEAVTLLLAALSDESYFHEDVGDYYGGPWYEARCVSDAAEQTLERAADLAALAPALDTLLTRGSARGRKHAARLLKQRVEARPLLLRALDDEDGPVRLAALESLLALRPKTSPLDDEQLLRRLLDHVWDADGEVSRASAEGLAKLDLHPRFTRMVNERLPEWRARVVDPASDDTQRISMSRVLQRVPDDADAAALLVDILILDRSTTLLRYAAESLATTRVRLGRARVDALLELAATPRMSYARPPFFTVLVNQFADPGRLAEIALPFALEGEPRVIESAPLFEEVTVAARVALKWCGEAVRPLLPRIAERVERDEPRAVHLVSILPAVADVGVGLLVGHLRRQPDAEKTAAALEAIGRLGERAAPAFPAVLERIQPSAHWAVTTAATRAIAAMGEVARNACPAIEAVLERREHQVLMLYAITEMGKNAWPLRPVLVKLAESSDSAEVRRLAQKLVEQLR